MRESRNEEVTLSAVMVIFSALPVPLSCADTWRMPFASISKVTSIWGTPRGAGGRPVSSNLPENDKYSKRKKIDQGWSEIALFFGSRIFFLVYRPDGHASHMCWLQITKKMVLNQNKPNIGNKTQVNYYLGLGGRINDRRRDGCLEKEAR